MWLWLLLGCGPSILEGDGGLRLLAGDEAAPPVRATWPADVWERSRVVVSDDAGDWIATDWQAAGTGSATATVLGPWAGGAWTARLELEGGAVGEPVDLLPAALPPGFPELVLDGTAPDVGWTLVSILSTDRSYAALLDAAGHVVFFHELSGNQIAGGGRTRPRRDGRGIWWAAMDEQPATLYGVGWTGDALGATKVDRLNHDFTELADGTFAWVSMDCRTLEELGRVCGNKLVVGPPGAELTPRFTTWDRFEPGVDGPVDPEDDNWTHANALVVDEREETAWFGLRNLDVLLHLDLATGDVIEQIGGPHATFSSDSAAELHHQHRLALVDDDTLLVHDNRTAAVGSRIVRLSMDREAGTVSGESVWVHDPPLWDYVLGDVDQRDDGSVRVTWSTGGAIDELGADGSLRSSLSAPLGSVFGYSTSLATLPGMALLR